MEKLEEKLKKAGKAIGTGFLAGTLIFSPLYMNKVNAQTRQTQSYVSLNSIKRNAASRGYITVDELQVAFDILASDLRGLRNLREGFNFYAEAIKKNWLPFKPMFYLSLEKENYDEAEVIRRTWMHYLGKFYAYADVTSTYGEIDSTEAIEVKQRIKSQYEKLKVAGLTDPLLITLRKELAKVIGEKNWDDAQKIQSVITSRMTELKPLQSPQNVKVVPEGQYQGGTAQQPSEQYLKVEQIPRYGSEDIGRALSLMGGQGGRLDPKVDGTLKLIDILLGR